MAGRNGGKGGSRVRRSGSKGGRHGDRIVGRDKSTGRYTKVKDKQPKVQDTHPPPRKKPKR